MSEGVHDEGEDFYDLRIIHKGEGCGVRVVFSLRDCVNSRGKGYDELTINSAPYR